MVNGESLVSEDLEIFDRDKMVGISVKKRVSKEHAMGQVRPPSRASPK